MKIKKKLQKPIEADAHFRYRCPDIDCACDHWLSLKQTQTKNFKVVCFCGKIFKPKRISKIKICYHVNPKPKTAVCEKKETICTIDHAEIQPLSQPEQPILAKYIPQDIQKGCVKLLTNYGFTNDEAEKFIFYAYQRNPENNIASLTKYILENINALENH